MYNFIKDKLKGKALGKAKGKASGFTLTELIIVIVIIAILASVMYPSLTGYIAKAKRINDISLIKELNDNIELNSILDEDINININNYKTNDVLLFNKIDHRYYLYSIKNNTLYNEDSDNIELSKDYYYFDDSLDLDNIFTLYIANNNDDDSIIEEPATPIPKEDNIPQESSETAVFITKDINYNTINEYHSLEEVLASSDTSVLLDCDDYVINNEITITKSLTIDLNSHTLTLNNNLIIDSSSSVTITNNTGTSAVATITINNNYAIINNSNNNNELNMSNFTLNGNVTNNGKCNIDNMVINGTVENKITCNITNSTVTTIKDSSNGYILYMMTLIKVTINIINPSQNICIHSGKFYSNPSGCSVISGASLTYDSSNEYWIVN